jgi:uncharacterized protein (TIGR03067 family)
MRRNGLIVVAGALLLAGPLGAQESAKDELAKLQGAWKIVTHERDGKPVATDKNARVVMNGNKFVTKAGDKVLREGTLKLDPAQKPPAIDVTYTEGPFKGQTLKGVYELDGDSWKICYGEPGEERPKQIPARAGKGQLLLILER